MTKSISFIIPTFCTDLRLLRRSIESVVALPADWDIEIIVIDDGTPDSHAADIVSEFADKRISYHYQENSGPGQARNSGIGKATKEYIQFLDADDYLLPNVYEKCLDIIEYRNPDLLVFDFKNVYDLNIVEVPTPKSFMITHQTSGTDFMLNNNFPGAACNIIVKRDILHGLPFTPGILHEDEEFRTLLFLHSERTIVTKLKPYAYYHHSQSTMGGIEPHKLERRFNDMIYVINSLRSHSASLDGKGKAALDNRIAQICEAVFINLLRLSPGKAFFRKWFNIFKTNLIYPLPACKCNLKHKLFRFATNTDWKVRLTYLILNRR